MDGVSLENIDYTLLWTDLQQEEPAQIKSINLYQYVELMKKDSQELRKALDVLLAHFPPIDKENNRQISPSKRSAINKKKTKKNTRKQKVAHKKLHYIWGINPELFTDKNREQDLTPEVADKLRCWAGLHSVFADTINKLDLGILHVNLKRYNQSKKSEWIRKYVREMIRNKQKEKSVASNNKKINDQNDILLQNQQDIEIFEDEVLQLRDEFISEESYSSKDECSNEKALLSESLNKVYTCSTPNSDQSIKSVDTFFFFVELVSQWYRSEMPEQIELIANIENKLSEFEEWHKEYRKFFKFQRDNLGYSHDLITEKYSNKDWDKENLEYLIENGKNLLIPVETEISHLEFIVNEYDEWLEEFLPTYSKIIEVTNNQTSFLETPENYEQVDRICNEIKFLPWICDKDKEMLVQITGIAWLKKAEDLMNGLHKSTFSFWIHLAEEVSVFEADSYLFHFDIFKQFEKEYNVGWILTELNSNKKADSRRISPSELPTIIKLANHSKIFLEEEVEALTVSVKAFEKNQQDFYKMINEKAHVDDFKSILKSFELGPCVYKEEKEFIQVLLESADRLKYALMHRFPEFDYGKVTFDGKSGTKQKSLRSTKVISEKVASIKKSKGSFLTMAQLAELRKERLNTIDQKPSKKSKKKRFSVSSDSRPSSEKSKSDSLPKSETLNSDSKVASQPSESKCYDSAKGEWIWAGENTIEQEESESEQESELKSSSSENESRNTWKHGIKLLHEYLKLDCKFAEGEVFKHQIDEQRNMFDSYRKEVWKIERHLSDGLQKSFYLTGDIDIDIDTDGIKSKDESIYFEYSPQIENSQLVDIINKAKEDRASEFKSVESVLEDMGSPLRTFENLWIQVQGIRNNIEHLLVDFDIEKNETCTIIDSLEIKLFLRIYELQMFRPREYLIHKSWTTEKEINDLKLLKQELEGIIDNLEEWTPCEKYNPIRDENSIIKIDFEFIQEYWWDSNFLCQDFFYMLSKNEVTWFKNIINEVYRYSVCLDKSDSFLPLDSFKHLTAEDMIVDYTKQIEKKKGRLRRSGKVKSKQKKTIKQKQSDEEVEDYWPSSWCKSIKRKRKLKAHKLQDEDEESTVCSFKENYDVSEVADSSRKGAWILKVESCKKRIEKRDNKRQELLNEINEQGARSQKGLRESTLNKRDKHKKGKFTKRSTVNVGV